MKLFILSLALCLLFAAAQEDLIPKGRRVRTIIAEKYTNNNVWVGSAFNVRHLNKPHAKIHAREFNYMIPHNAFKHYIHPKPDVWSWSKPDSFIKFAEEHNQIIRMHSPIGPQCSKWARHDDRTAEELLKNMTEYLTAVCKRYNGHPNVRWMDVVNEVVDKEGNWKSSEPGIGHWELPWTVIGYRKDVPDKFEYMNGKVPIYIIKAFEIATKHAPDIKLVLNQHGGMEEDMWDRVKDLVLYLLSLGLRVDGIGWQGHLSNMKEINWEPGDVKIEELSELITWAHANNLEFHITEQDIYVSSYDEEESEEHAELFASIFKTLLEKRHTGVVTYNGWEMFDRDHYSRKETSVIGLWDRNLKAKPAYYKMQELLENPPPVK
jgi:GH35 family endo-1,4-beta-xylanase